MNGINGENKQVNERIIIENARRGFNLAIFLGCCVLAFSIYMLAVSIRSAGVRIATSIPHASTVHHHGIPLQASAPDREFMSEWEAASFLAMDHSEFARIIESGELSGTYAVFQVERELWRPADIDPDEWRNYSGAVQVPVRVEVYDIVIGDHRVFSRERLTEWLMSRIDNE